MDKTGFFRLVPEDLRHLVPGFLERRVEDVAKLKELLNESDFAGIQRLGHRLKGVGSGFGFPVVTDIGRKIEEAGKAANAADVRAAIAELSAVTAQIKRG